MATSGANGNRISKETEKTSRCAREKLIVQQLLARPTNGGDVRKAALRRADNKSRSTEQLDEIIYLLRALLLLLSPGDIGSEPEREKSPPQLDPGGMRQRYGLTPRETEVLAEMALGKSNRQIALELSVSVDTIRSHVSHILSKMGAESRTEAAVQAVYECGAFREEHPPGKARDVAFPLF